MILLEGVDCVGKSTVAMELRRLLPGWAYRYHTRPPEGVPAFKYHFWGLTDAHPRVVLDRLHWSEAVYGEVYRNSPGYDYDQWRKGELILASRGTRVLYLCDEPAAIRARWDATQARQMYTSERLARLLAGYQSLVDKTNTETPSSLPTLVHALPELWDLRARRPTQALRELAAQERGVCAAVDDLLPASIGVGSPWAKFVVLGESPRDQQEVRDDSPQVPLFGGVAMAWLWRAFDELGLCWWRGYYTNVSAFESAASLGKYFSQAVPVADVLCLGARAKATVAQARREGHLAPHVRVHGVSHPSFTRRFERGKFVEYRRKLHAALEEWCCHGVS